MDIKNLSHEDLLNINILATIATSLDVSNYKGITESDLYYSALIDFLKESKGSVLIKTLNSSHQKMVLKNGYGHLLQCSIALSLFEKQFRENEIKDKKIINSYNKLAIDYQKAINLYIEQASIEPTI
ncbi:MAG: hypothetical protein J6Q13_01625 [Clostridia bacterium]|nr:hypothetical protein [Clostridia bacterium]